MLDKVNGQFVFFASADDVMLPHMVETFVKVWREQRVALVTSNALYNDENSNFLNRTFRKLGQPADDSVETLARDGSNACCFGAAMGMDRLVYETFGWPATHFLQASDIILPFHAYFVGGARFLHEPLLKYRVHSRNSSLSLQSERSAGEAQLMAEEKAWQDHVAHEILFNEELDRFLTQFPGRFNTLVARLRPLVDTQIVEMSRKLVRTRKALYSLRRNAAAF